MTINDQSLGDALMVYGNVDTFNHLKRVSNDNYVSTEIAEHASTIIVGEVSCAVRLKP